jgi:hypothetical protein
LLINRSTEEHIGKPDESPQGSSIDNRQSGHKKLPTVIHIFLQAEEDEKGTSQQQNLLERSQPLNQDLSVLEKVNCSSNMN